MTLDPTVTNLDNYHRNDPDTQAGVDSDWYDVVFDVRLQAGME